MAKISKLLKSLDFLSPEHAVNYNGKNRERSVVGACFTLLLGLITVALGFLVGKDIFFKSNPVTRMNLKLGTDNEIYLKDFPISVNKLVNLDLNRAKFDEQFILKPKISFIDATNPKVKTSYDLKVEPCTEEQFDMIPDWRETMGANISEVDCIQNEIYDEHGNVMDQEPFIRGERGQHLSWLIEMKLERKGDPSRPLPLEYNISLGMATVYVDNSNYENPTSTKFTSIFTPVDYLMRKTVYIETSQETISSDSGLIFSSVSTSTFSTYKSNEIAYALREESDPKLIEFKVTGTKMANAFEREYIKLPSVFAEASAMGKLVFWVFKVIMKEVAAFKFYSLNVKRVKHAKISTNINDSGVEIRTNQDKNTPLPSFLQFVFSSKATFNCNFVSKNEILKQFDLLEIRKSIEAVKKVELKPENKRIPFSK